ncbi:high-affinity branched-chain amino acid ABC transporter permease LivM [Terrarubrum flagellatum]|uniref:high-affinity branched-chain amino acid ABC transporter permease LivM n=1 Tax=Terrirubrum flagellatum TaxID=2895980 RepID=UPI0031450F6C
MAVAAKDQTIHVEATRIDFATAVRDAFLAAVVMLGLCVPMLAWRTEQNMSNELVLIPRWGAVAIACSIVFLGRLALSLFVWNRGAAKPRSARTTNLFALAGRGALVTAGVLVFIACAVVAWALTRQMTMIGYVAAFAVGVFLVMLALFVYNLGSAGFERAKPFLGPAALGFIAIFPLVAIHYAGWQGALKWIDNFGIQILIYVMLGWGLNIVVGLAGLLDLGYVAFYAVGAYSYALLAKQFGLSFWLLMPVSGVLAAFWGILLGFPVLRLRGDYLAIVTLAFGEIIRLVLINWVDFSNGYAGISGIPRPSFFGIPFNADDDGFSAIFGLEFSPIYRTMFLYYVVLTLALVVAFVTMRLRRLPIGRAWEALREDEIACRALGINTVNTKLTAFAIGAGFGGLAGSFFAARQGFISPESFVFMESAVILAIVVLGGMGSLLGCALAAIAMIGGTEIMRELDFLKQIFGNDFDPTQYRMLLFGLAMVLIMIWKPRGLISTREPTIFLKEKKAVSGALVKEGHG